MSTNSSFEGGRNIAMKVPPHTYEETVRFYRDVLGLRELPEHHPSVVFEFGSNVLWIDRVPGLSQSEIWLEVRTTNLEAAEKLFERAQIVRRDEIEPLPDGLEAFWISSPASIIHLVQQRDAG